MYFRKIQIQNIQIMLKKVMLLLCFFLFFISCKKDCYTAPEKVVFEFVNSSGENLIENNQLGSFAIQEDAGNGNYTGIPLTKTADYKVIVEKIGSYNGTKHYQFASGIKLFDFSVRSSSVTTDCDGFQIDEIHFENVTATKENGYYKIVLD